MKRELHLENVTIGHFRPPDRPMLMIVATDVVQKRGIWFPDETPLDQALVASTAIPGIFPWREMTVGGERLFLADGGVVMNQPLSNLVEQGCGTIYACAVGSTGPLAPPKNLIDNALRAVNLAMHQATKLEEDYVRLKLAGDWERTPHPPGGRRSRPTTSISPQRSCGAWWPRRRRRRWRGSDENHPEEATRMRRVATPRSEMTPLK